jgi:predicted DNA-binding transcriptional regulator AlpA
MPLNRQVHSRPARAVAWASTDITRWMREQIAAAGGDPSSVPDEEFRFIRLRELKRRVGLGHSSIYRKIAAGEFPRSVTLGGSRREAA